MVDQFKWLVVSWMNHQAIYYINQKNKRNLNYISIHYEIIEDLCFFNKNWILIKKIWVISWFF